MKTKRILSLFLTVTMLMGMLVFPSTSAVAVTDDATAANNALPKVVFWGDSLTYGAGDFNKAYPLVFQDLIESNFGFTIAKDNNAAGTTNKLANRGCGANSMAQVAARSGAVPFTIKTSGGVTSTTEEGASYKLSFNEGNYLFYLDTWYRNVSSLSGWPSVDNVDHTSGTYRYVPVALKKGEETRYGAIKVGGTAYFKPEAGYSDWASWLPGATVETREADSFVSENYIPVIYIGTNDGVNAAATHAGTSISNFQYFVDSILTHYGITDKVNGKYVVIFPEFKGETAGNTALDNLGTSMASVYGDHFINLRTISKNNSDYDFSDTDGQGTHYYQKAYDAIAQLVYDKFDTLGYFADLEAVAGGSTPTHTHTYNGYSKDATQHWQVCTGCSVATAKVNHTYVNGVCVCGATEPHVEEPETLSISCKYDLFNIASKTCTLSSDILSSKGKAIVFAKTLPDSTHTVQGDLATFGLYAAHNVIFDGKTNNTALNASWGTLVTPFASQYWNSGDTSDAAVLSQSTTVTTISNVDFSYLTYRVKADSNKKITQLDTSIYARVPDTNGKQIGMYVMTPTEYASAIDSNGKINLYGKTAVWSFDSGNSNGSFVYDCGGGSSKDSTINTESLNSNELYVVVVMRRTYPSSLSFPPDTNSNYYSNYPTDSSSVRFFGIEIEATTITTHTHNYVSQDGLAATCTDAGYYGYKECQNDGCTVKYTDLDGNAIGDAAALATWKTTGAGKIAALGHQLDSGAELTAATCTTGGVTRYSCTRDNCEYYEDENTDPLGHQIDENVWENDATNHWHVCTRPGCDAPIVGTAAHTFDGSPCGGSQCTVCGYQAEAGSHTLVHHAAVTGDYDTTGRCEGNVEYWQCSECGAYFLDEDATQPTTKAGVVYGSHSWENVYTYNVANHWIRCSKCGKVKDSTVPHSYGAYTSDATTHSRTCTVCNYTETYSHKPAGDCKSESSTSCSKCGKTGISAGHDYVNGYCSKCGATDYAYNPENQGQIHVHDDILIHKNPEMSNIYNNAIHKDSEGKPLPTGYYSGLKENNVFSDGAIVRSCIDIKTGDLFIKNSNGTSGNSDGKVKTVSGSAVSKGYVSDLSKFAVYDAHHVFIDSSSANADESDKSNGSMVYLTTCDTSMWHNTNDTYSMGFANKSKVTDYGQYDYGVSLFDKSTWTTSNKVDFAYVTYKVATTDGSKLKDLYFTPYGRIAVNNNIQLGFMLTKDPISDDAFVDNYENSSSTDKACVLEGFSFDDFVCILSNEYYTDNAPSSCNLDGKVSVLKTADDDDTRVALYQKYPDAMTHLPVADDSTALNSRTSFDFYGRGNNDRLDLDLSKAVAEMDTDTAYITVVLLTPGDSINTTNGNQRLSGYQTHTAIRITGFDVNPPEAYQVNIDKYDTYYMGANVSLAEEVKMNFYASFGTEDFARVQNGDWNVQITAGNEGNKNYKMVKVIGVDVCDSDLAYTGNDKNGNTAVDTYKFTISVPAKMMSDKLTFKVIDTKTGLAVIDEEYSIKEYCADVKAAYGKNSPTSEYTIDALEEVVNAMLDYGTAAQQYLDYHTDNLANDGNWVSGIDNVVPAYSEGLTNSTGACDIKLAAGNINLEENIHLRLCLAYTNGTKNNRDAYTVKLAYRAENEGEWIEYSTDAAENSGRKLVEYPFPDSDATPTKYNDRSELYYFYIPLMAKQMDDVVRIQVWKEGVCILERYYSINMYCYSMYTTSNINIKNATRVDHYEKLKKLCQATYSYGQEAQKYAQYGL